jgi:uncharacterized protein YndB with AHSA1/START domain
MWFDLTPTDLTFIERAPFHFDNEAVINASPARVFEILEAAEAQTEWFKDFKDARWLSDPPYGVGSTREVVLKALRVKERFVAWEPGRRMAFSIEAITLPLVSAMLEDLQFEPMGEGRTRFRWRAYYQPTIAMRLVHPIARGVFGGMFSASTSGLAAYATKNP